MSILMFIMPVFHGKPNSFSCSFSKDVLNHSDHKAILQLANLVEGIYTFELKVEDNRGLSSTDTVVLTVKEGTIH